MIRKLSSATGLHRFIGPVAAMTGVLFALASGAARAAFYRVDYVGGGNNPFADSTDSATHGGTGTVGDPFHMASLRGAVMHIDTTHTAADTIILPAGTYTLSIAGAGEAAAPGVPAAGDVDIRFTGLTIQGAGAATTIIQQTAASVRVLDVNPMFNVGNFFFTIDGVTLTGGREASGDAGALYCGSNDTGLGTRGNTSITNCVFKNNQLTGAGLGGGAIQHVGGNLTVSNCVFGGAGGTDPNTAATSGGAIAAIGYQAAGTVTISNCTFTNNVANSAASGGGAIDLVNINLGTATSTITNCTFTGNNAANASGGAILNESQGGATISKCTFVNNHAFGNGGVLYGSATLTTIEYSRFVGNTVNTPANGNVMAQATNGGSITANNNWWGHNNGPATNDKGAGSITATKWLQLKLSALASTIPPNGSTTLTGSFLSDSDNNAISTSNLGVLIGQPIAFTGGSFGSIASPQATIQAAGTATATFNAGPIAGVSVTTAQVDGAPAATANITIPPSVTSSTANLAANAASMTIAGTGFDNITPGNNVVTFNNGATGTITAATNTQLTVTSLSGLVSGSLTAIVTTNSVSSGAAVQVATVFPVVTTSAANLAANATTMTINGFGFSTTPANNTVAFSGSVTGTVTAATKTQLTVTSLTGLIAGTLNASVTSNGQTSGAAVQVATVIPVVTSSVANLAATATGMTINGFGFSSTPANNTVTFSGGATGTVTAATATQLTISSLTGLVGGALNASVTSNSVSSGAAVQVATVTPVVTSSTANLAANATTITINGFGFSGTPANNTVVFNDSATGSVTAASATSITVTFGTKPANAGSLTAIVTTNGASSGAAVQVATVIPVITSSAANLAANATTLTINGFGFSGTPANNTVSFSGGVTGTVTASSATTLTIGSLSGLTAGALNASVTSNTVSSGAAVQVATVIPVVTLNTANLLIAAPTITINGFGFSATPANNTVAFNLGAAGTVTAATATQLTVTFSAQPTSPGALTAVVTSNGAGSGAPVQVATITAPPAFTNGPPPATGLVGTAYDFTYTASGGPAPTFSVTAGALPTSLTLSGAGVISGTPTVTGNFTGTVTASNGIAPAATQDFSITISGPPLFTSAPPTATGKVGTAYSFTCTASGFPAPTFGVTAGALPSGLALNASGLISGTPSVAGVFTGTITATNGIAPAATQNFSITISETPAFTNGPPPSPAIQNTAYSFTYTATGSPAPTFTVTAGTLPTGLTLSPAGLLSGTPTAVNTFTGTVTATNSAGTATQNFSITVNAAGATTITTTKDDGVEMAVRKNAGDTIDYSINVNNTGAASATGVVVTDPTPANTTLVAGSVNVSPLALNDSYTAIGNTLLRVGGSAGAGPEKFVAGSVLDNDTEFLGDTFAATVITNGASTQGGTVNLAADGTFTYLPLAGFEGTDTFTYTISDDGATGSAALTGTGTVTITVSEVVWYVDDSAAGGGTGRSNAPLQSLAPINTGGAQDANDEADDYIFVYAGTYPNLGFVLEAGQRLIGQGVNLVVSGTTLVTGALANRPTLPHNAGSTLSLSTNNTVSGLNFTNSAGNGINGGAVSTLTLSDFDVTVTGGSALNLPTSGTVTATGTDNDLNSTNGTALNVVNTTIGAAGLTFRSINTTASSGSTGIALNNTGVNAGLTVTGTGVANSGGTISNKTGSADGISLTNTRSISLTDMAIATIGGSWIDATNVNGLTLVRMNADLSTDHGLLASSLTNLVVQGGTFNRGGFANAAANFDGFHITNLHGNSSITDALFQRSNTRQVFIVNNANPGGAVDILTVSNNDWNTHNTGPFGGDHLSVSADTGGNFRLIVNNTGGANVFKTGGIGVQATGAGSGKMDAQISGITSGGTIASGDANTAGVVVAGTASSTVTFVVASNTMLGTGSLGMSINDFTSGAFSGTLQSNSITHVAGFGTDALQIVSHGDQPGSDGTATIAVLSNTITGDFQRGIRAQCAFGDGTLNLNITGNTVQGTTADPTALRAIEVEIGGSGGGTTNRIFLNLENNDASMANGNAGYRLLHRAGYTFSLEDLTGSGTDVANIQNWVDVVKTNDAIGGGAAITLVTGVANNFTSHASTPAPLLFAPAEPENFSFGTPDSVTSAIAWTEAVRSSDQSSVVSGQSAVVGDEAKNRNAAVPAAGVAGVPPATAEVSGETPGTPTGVTPVLQQTQLDSLVAAARARWEATGLSDAQLAALDKVTFAVADLPGWYLGEAAGQTIRVDNNAGGNGWFIDATPLEDGEFSGSGTLMAAMAPSPNLDAQASAFVADRVDLLTTLMHEMGHAIGLCDTYSKLQRSSVMYGFLTKGERRLPMQGEAAGAVPHEHAAPHFLAGPITIGTLPAGKSVKVVFRVTVNTGLGASVTQISNQGVVSGNNFPNVPTDDVNVIGTNDPTVTLLNFPPTFTDGPPPASALVGTPYSFTYTATGAPAPAFTVTAGGLPTGLSLSGAGAITGTPTAAGVFTGTVTATNSAGTATQNFSITVPQLPAITNGPPPAGSVNTAYAFAYTATGSPAPTFAVTAGALPTGLTLSNAGVITGTPTTAGTFTGTVTATNSAGAATQNFSIAITQPPAFTNGPPPSPAALNAAYNFTYTATGSPAPTFSVTAGALPTGLTLSAAGAITGTATAAGTFTGTVTSTNSAGTATQDFTIVIGQAPAFTNGPPPSSGAVGTAYSFGYTATGSPAPTFSVTAGALPTGLSLSGPGAISGTPTANGIFTGTVTATNTAGTATQNFSITIGDTVSIATVNAGADDTAAESGDTGLYTFTRSSTTGTLTADFHLNAGSTATAADFTLSGGGVTFNAGTGNGTVTFPAGDATVAVTLTAPVESPNAAELAETVIFEVVAQAGVYSVSGSAATVTIAQNGFAVVNTNDNGAGSLRQAIANADFLGGTDTITFAGATFTDATPDTTTLTSGELVVISNLTVQGPGASLLKISGGNASRVLRVASGSTVTLSGLTIADGNGVGGGQNGAGGGIYNQGTLMLRNCVVSGNNANDNGGGIQNVASLSLIETTVANNVSSIRGGGVHTIGASATVTVISSTVSGNNSVVAGGLANGIGTMTVTNSTISGNAATQSAGGILNSFGTLTVSDSTITGNRSDSDGNASGAGGGIDAGGTETVSNTIVAGNVKGASPGTTPSDVEPGSIDTASNNLIGDAGTAGGIVNGANGNLVGNAGVGVIPIATILAPLANNGGPTETHALVSGSPAINAGSNTLIAADTLDFDGDTDTVEKLPYDQRGVGFPRIVVTTVDIGAVERLELTPSITNASTNEDTQTTSGLVLTRHPGDTAPDATHFKVTAITNGTLFQNDTTTAVPNGTFLTFAQANAGLKFTPAADFVGSGSFQVQASTNGADSGLGGDVVTATITVNAVNDAPSFNLPVNAPTVDEDAGAQTVASYATAMSVGPANESGQTLVGFTITPTGSTGGLTFSTPPAINTATGTLTYTPAANANGTATFSVTLTDNGANSPAPNVNTSPPQSFTITVNAVNDVPSVTKGADQTVNEDAGAQTVSGWATALSAGPSNEAAQTLDFIVSNNNNALFSAQPAVAANGTLTYAPAANANGSATVTVQIHDNGGTANGGADTSAAQTFTITITEVNDAPTAVADTLANAVEDSAPIVFAASTLVTNDLKGPANESGQTLTVTAVSAPGGGTVSLSAGNITFTPFADFNGTANFTYTVSDNGTTNGANDFKTANGTVTFTITEVNDAPTAVADTLANAPEDTPIVFAASTLTTNDSKGPANETGQTLTVTAVSAPVGGTVALASGTITFTPTSEFSGAAGFSYTVIDNGTTDGANDFKTATGTVAVTITEVNDPPVAVDDTRAAIDEDAAPLVITGATLTANDTLGAANESGQTLTVISAGSAVGGSVSVAAGDVTFTPTPNYNGPASFAYTVSDNGTTNGAADPKSDVGVMTFTINSVNDNPVAGPNTIERYPTQGVKVTVAALLSNDTDVDGGTVAFVSAATTSANGGAVSVSDGQVFYLPAPGFFGTDTFTYGINDGQGGTATGTVTVALVVDNAPGVNITKMELLPDGSRRVSFAGIPFRSYTVQTSDTLAPGSWTDRGSRTADGLGKFQFIDPPVLPPQRFYRSVAP